MIDLEPIKEREAKLAENAIKHDWTAPWGDDDDNPCYCSYCHAVQGYETSEVCSERESQYKRVKFSRNVPYPDWDRIYIHDLISEVERLRAEVAAEGEVQEQCIEITCSQYERAEKAEAEVEELRTRLAKAERVIRDHALMYGPIYSDGGYVSVKSYYRCVYCSAYAEKMDECHHNPDCPAAEQEK